MLSFLSLQGAAYALFVAVGVVIVLLFLIRSARPRVMVSSTLIWQRVMGQTGIRGRRWRWILSLLLSLMIGLSLALAATRPQSGVAARRSVVVVDNTVSMAARTSDGRSRWEHAIAKADELISTLGGGAEVMLLDTAGQEAPTGFIAAGPARERLARMRLSSRTDGRFPPLPGSDEIDGTYLFTDGVGIGRVPESVVVHSVFELADNVAITGFDARPVPGEPTRYQAFLQIANAGSDTRSVALDVRGDRGFRLSRELQVAGDSVVNLTLDVSDYDQGPLRARISSAGDAFDVDDSAYCLVLSHRARRVLLVTSGNPLLEDTLRLLPGVSLTVTSPAQYPRAREFDAYVFDRHAPSEPPPAGALLFRPTAAPWLDAKWRAAGRVQKLRAEGTQSLTAEVDWRDIRVESTLLARTTADRIMVTADSAGESGWAIIVAGRARARWAAVGFALEDSNLPLQAGFPVFLDAALQWLSPGPSVMSAAVGWIEVPVSDATVFEAGGERVSSTGTPGGTLFEAPRPGVYKVEGGSEAQLVVVNASDLRMAQINRRQRVVGTAAAGSESGRSYSWAEPGVLLLGVALALLLAEWTAFSRGATE